MAVDSSWSVIDVLIKSSSDDQWECREEQIVESDVPVIEKWLSWVPTHERKEKLRDRKYHVLVEEVQDHLRNTDVGPMPMHKDEPP